jgi:hypothetical protein
MEQSVPRSSGPRIYRASPAVQRQPGAFGYRLLVRKAGGKFRGVHDMRRKHRKFRRAA